MKVVIIGGTGLVGSKLAATLRSQGHEVIAASPNTGVNTLTGEGLAEALIGADTVVDVSNSPSFEDNAVLDFFQTSTRNQLAAEKVANVKHHVALSIVGSERLPASGYLRAKVAQENLIKMGEIPYSILRSTQFFEFAKAIAQSATQGSEVHVPDAYIQPIATDDLIPVLAGIATAAASNRVVEIGGPEKFRFAEWMRKFLSLTSDSRGVITDPQSRYFGTQLHGAELTAGDDSFKGTTTYNEWFKSQAVPA